VALAIAEDLIMAKKKKASDETTKDSSSVQPQLPAVPPPDDPLRRGTEFDPDREYKSREVANKRLEAIQKTQKMPRSNEDPATGESEKSNDSGSEST
jgi:hypothetical protein